MNKWETYFPISKWLTSAFLLVGHWWDWQWFSWYFTIWRFSTLWLDMIFQVISSRVVFSYLITTFKINNILDNIYVVALFLVQKFLIFPWSENNSLILFIILVYLWSNMVGWVRWVGEKEHSVVSRSLCILSFFFAS